MTYRDMMIVSGLIPLTCLLLVTCDALGGGSKARYCRVLKGYDSPEQRRCYTPSILPASDALRERQLDKMSIDKLRELDK